MNLIKTDDLISGFIEYMFINRDDTALTVLLKSLAPKAHHKARGKGSLMNQFYIYRMFNGQNIFTLIIKYKAPHKLS
jgi:hypothetical protein